jgi:hypothetical protein
MFAETDPNSTGHARHIEARFVFVAVAWLLAGLVIYTGNAQRIPGSGKAIIPAALRASKTIKGDLIVQKEENT